ncbi:MAG: TonB-dependent receptor, partial [Pseudomonadota bacterium]
SITVIGGSLTLLIAPAWSQSAERVVIDLPAQSLANSLVSLASQTGVDIVAPGSLVSDRTAPALSGAFTPEEAAQTLISGSNLNVRTGSTGSLIITRLEASEDDFDVLLDEVLITTRRTEERLKDVPGSVTVLTNERLERSNINTTDDVILNTPGVSFTENSSPTGLEVSIRGISDLVGPDGTGPTNGIFLDGFLLNPTGSTLSLNPELPDLEQVEVAFGPQGTAFGRGTLGGAINFITKKPTDELEASLELEAGSFPDGRGTAIVNIPVLEDGLLSARLVAFGNISDGFIDLTNFSDPDTITSNNAGGRISLRSQPISPLTIDFSLSFDRTNQLAPFLATVPSVEAGDPINESGTPGGLDIDRFTTTANISYDAKIGTFKSNTGFLDTDVESSSDFDISGFDLLEIASSEAGNQSVSQEFRYESKEFDLPKRFGKIAFNVGTNFSFSEDGLFSSETVAGSDFLPTLTAPFPFPAQLGFLVGAGLIDPSIFAASPADQAAAVAAALAAPPELLGSLTTSSATTVDHFSVFGDFRFKPVDNLEIAAGVRFNRDAVSVLSSGATTGAFSALFPAPATVEFDDIFTAFTPNASVKYNWTEAFSTYVAFSTGYRPGGFAESLVTGGSTFDEERIRNIEGGFKSTFFDRRLAINASGYFLEYDDIQVFSLSIIDTPVGPVFDETITNAAAARSIGSEISITALPVNGLRLNASIGLNFSTFTDFATAPDFDGDSLPDDLTGSRLPNAPVHTFSLVADYEHPTPIFGDLRGFVRAEYNLRSSFASLIDTTAMTFDGFDIANFRAGLRGDNFSVTAFVENAFDEVYATGSSSLFAPSLVGTDPNVDIGATRRFGVVGTIKF